MRVVFLPMACAFAVFTFPSYGRAQNTEYYPIPNGYDFPAGFDFSSGSVPTPADFEKGEKILLEYLANNQFDKLRLHGWEVFAGMTQATPEGHAIWESWLSVDQVFDGPPEDRELFSETWSIGGNLESPKKLGAGFFGALPQAIGESVAVSVLFNQEAANHIWNNKLFQSQTLKEINDSHTANGTPGPERKITDFSRDSISLKTAWMLVKKDGLGILPVWDNILDDPTAPVQPALPPVLWKRCVAIDPTNSIPEGETRNIFCGGDFRDSRVVHISKFYGFEIDEVNIENIKSSLGEEAEVGDSAILIGFHYTTKEIPNWVWGTFWWHDEPEQGEFGNDRIEKITGVWTNYLMDVAYDFEKPVGDDGGPHDMQNPYIEARFPNGVRSNCMTCHARSTYPRLPPEENAPEQDICGALPVTRGQDDFPLDDPRRNTRTQTDFLWSLLLRPHGDNNCQ